MLRLHPKPLSAHAFAPFGDVISAADVASAAMNDARFDRFDRLATVDVDDAGDVAVGIVRSRTATALPYEFDLIERHPCGSQAFIPLHAFRFVVVVAAAGDSVTAADLHAFVSDGSQGVNYHRGTWHMPLIASAPEQSFLVIDRAPGAGNLDELRLPEPVILEEPDD